MHVALYVLKAFTHIAPLLRYVISSHAHNKYRTALDYKQDFSFLCLGELFGPSFAENRTHLPFQIWTGHKDPALDNFLGCEQDLH